MIEEGDFLRRLIEKLETAQIAYLVTGSLASSYWGHPRATNDLDIIIAPTSRQLSHFLKLFDENYYLSEEAAREAFKGRRMFNIIDHKSGWKADLIIHKNRPHDIEVLQRRREGQIFGVRATITSPEDSILSKLVWSKASDSERQLRDAKGIIEVQAENLDVIYMRRWAKSLGVEDLLERLLGEAKRLGI